MSDDNAAKNTDDTRVCTCHPDDLKAYGIKSCQKGHALSDCRISFLTAEVERLKAPLITLFKAIDSGNLKMSSPEVGGDVFVEPHPWHEEWLYHTRAAIEAMREFEMEHERRIAEIFNESR